MSSENYKERCLLFIRWLPVIVRRSTLSQRVYSSNVKKRLARLLYDSRTEKFVHRK